MGSIGVPERSHIPGTNMSVDAFRSKERPRQNANEWLYFLTHFHADHYQGLTPNWNEGLIFCSEITSKLLRVKFGQDLYKCIRILPMNEEFDIGNGCLVVAIDANHCPGAIQLLFKVPTLFDATVRTIAKTVKKEDLKLYIHCGDCRWSDDWEQQSKIQGRILSTFRNCDAIFLDTTYCQPKFTFPRQESSIEFIANKVYEALHSCHAIDNSEDIQSINNKRVIVCISTYVIGKEKILERISSKCNIRVYIPEKKLELMRCYLEETSIRNCFTINAHESPVHVADWGFLGDTFPFFRPNFVAMERLRKAMGAEKIIGILPTGWAFQTTQDNTEGLEGVTKRSKGASEIYLVPYSEHSSYSELRHYVEMINPKQIIPTVGPGTRDLHSRERAKVLSYFRDLIDNTQAKRKFLAQMQSHDDNEITIDNLSARSSTQGMCSEVKLQPDKPLSTQNYPESEVDCIDHLALLVGDKTLARELLRKADNDVNLAANSFLDKRKADASSAAKEQKKRRSSKQTTLNAFVIKSSDSILSTPPPPHKKLDKSESLRSDKKIEIKENFSILESPNKEKRDLNSSLPYSLLVDALAEANSTQKRTLLNFHLASVYKDILEKNSADLCPAIYLTLGKLGPDHEKLELSVGGSSVSTALCEATGVTRTKLRALYRSLGDLGDVAFELSSKQSLLIQHKPLTISHVFKTLHKIAKEAGHGSASRKQSLMTHLLRSCKGEEVRFITRTLIQNMRIGANTKSVISAVAHAFSELDMKKNECQTKSDVIKRLCRAFLLRPSFDLLLQSMLEKGLESTVADCSLRAGIPCKPMLAKVARGLHDIVDIFEKEPATEMLAEFKYDGVRCQIHFMPDGKVKIFSRNCEDKTDAFPDAISAMIDAAVAEPERCNAIFDGEIVAIDKESLQIKSFQELSTRARGPKSENESIQTDVCVMIFDVLATNQGSLVEQDLKVRREVIHKILPNMRPGSVQLAQSTIFKLTPPSRAESETDQIQTLKEEISTYFKLSLDQFSEGLMFKHLHGNDATYQPDSRLWLKLKKDYLDQERDTLDLVPIGAWHGNGRKAQWFSPFLLACYDEESETYQSVCRCMSGFSDEFYREKTASYSNRILPSKPIYYQTNETCSVWFEPTEVWEIVGADFTISPTHLAAAGHVHSERGISLRFPRFLRERPDKNCEDSTTPECIKDLYIAQSRKPQQQEK